MGIHAVDICKGISCTNASAWSRGSNNIPSRLRRDFLRCRSVRTAVLSELDLCRSKARAQNRCTDGGQRFRRCRLRPSDRHGCGRDRGESSPTHGRSRYNPPGRCPTGVPISRAPSVSNSLSERGLHQVFFLPLSWISLPAVCFYFLLYHVPCL